jgi:kinesin family member 1
MTATGKYEPVECRKSSLSDSGAFILHLGVQRRLQLVFSHCSGNHLKFKRVAEVKIGSIREIDSDRKLVSSSTGQKSSSMRVLNSKVLAPRQESQPVEALTTFDTSLSHEDPMDRKTPTGNRIIVSLTVNIECERVSEPIPFSMDIAVEVHSRNSSNGGWLAMFTPARPITTASYGLFELVLTPTARRGRRTQWKRTSAQVYIRGEESLGGWRPRGISLLHDFHTFEEMLARKVDLEIARFRSKGNFEQREGSEMEYRELLEYCLKIWKTPTKSTTPYVSLPWTLLM